MTQDDFVSTILATVKCLISQIARDLMRSKESEKEIVEQTEGVRKVLQVIVEQAIQNKRSNTKQLPESFGDFMVSISGTGYLSYGQTIRTVLVNFLEIPV